MVRNLITLAILLILAVGCCKAQQDPINVTGIESGTLVFSNKASLVGRIAKRVTGGDRYTHVAVVIDGYVYESDWPRAKKTPVAQYGKRFTTNDYYQPTQPLNTATINAMRSQAESMLGQRYSLKRYFNPARQTKGTQTKGTWCSPFAGQVLNAGGYNLSPAQYHEPQSIHNTISQDYTFAARVSK